MPNVPLLPTAEVAERLGRDVRTIHRWVDAGRITPAIKAPGLRGALMFAADEVDRVAVELAQDGAA